MSARVIPVASKESTYPKKDSLKNVDDKNVPSKFKYEKPRQKSAFNLVAEEYLAATTLHGFQYLGENGRHILERFLWSICIIGSFTLCVFMVLPFYTKWQTQHTITTVDETNYPIWNINFPAITICSNNKIVQHSFDLLMKQQPWKNLTLGNENFTANFYEALKGTILFDVEPEILDDLDNNVIEIMNTYKKKIPLVLQKVMQSCSNLILACTWQGKTIPCANLFSVRRTDDGYCCSFNTLRMSEQFLNQNELESGIEGDYVDYYYDDYESTTTTQTTTTDSSGCEYPDWVGDEYCDDENNNVDCSFDGGDCCGDNVDTSFCSQCLCLEDQTSSALTTTTTSTTSTSTTEVLITTFDQNETTMDGTTDKKKPITPTKLKRINAATAKLGLSVLLHPDKENYQDAVLNNFAGFKVLVHSPYDFARVAAKGFTIDTKVEAFIAIGAQYTESTDVVKEMSLSKRSCLRHDEDVKEHENIKLNVFANYSREACLLECQAEEIFNKCNCLPYYFPDFSEIWKKNTSCNFTEIKCLSGLSDQIGAVDPRSSENHNAYEKQFIEGPYCNCPSDCEETVYSQEMSQANIIERNRFMKKLQRPGYVLGDLLNQILSLAGKKKYEKKREKLEKYYDSIINTSSIVHFYFKELGIVKYQKEQLYGALDILAAFGGLVGLCTGFSILSAMEILYWFIIRLSLTYFKKKNCVTTETNKTSNI